MRRHTLRHATRSLTQVDELSISYITLSYSHVASNIEHWFNCDRWQTDAAFHFRCKQVRKQPIDNVRRAGSGDYKGVGRKYSDRQQWNMRRSALQQLADAAANIKRRVGYDAISVLRRQHCDTQS